MRTVHSAIMLPAVKAVVTVHKGPYQKVWETYNRVQEWMREKKAAPTDYMWEVYLNDPTSTPSEDLMTEIIWPIK